MNLQPWQRLENHWREIRDLESLEELLEWDQETMMPPKGQDARGRLAATVAGLKHRLLVDDALWDVLAACAETAEELAGADRDDDLANELAAEVRVALRQVARARAVPEDLERAIAIARSDGFVAWRKAREAGEFDGFADSLARLVDLRLEEIAARRDSAGLEVPADAPAYDVLLGDYEPGSTVAQLEPLFSSLRRDLAPVVEAVAESGIELDASAFRGELPHAGQRELGLRAMRAIGFDLDAGRLDPAAHPFCVGMAPGDVRLTWRWDETDLRSGLFGVLHEAGHGLYEQGLPARFESRPLGVAVSLGIHESQSRLWENHVGRSLGFWRFLAPHVDAIFPGREPFDPEAAWPALHTVEPSLIRVEADAVTYHLHVAIRFEIERALLGGELDIDDLPSAWNQLYRETLGVEPPHDGLGVLQDVHWSHALFGYFPTYSVGSLAAAQLFQAAERDLGPLDPAFADGEFAPLLGWLRTHVHRHGSRFEASELIERATGAPLGTAALIGDLRRTVEAAYGLEIDAPEPLA